MRASVSPLFQNDLYLFAECRNIFDFLLPVVVDCVCCGTATNTMVLFPLHFGIDENGCFAFLNICSFYPLQSQQFFCKKLIEHIEPLRSWFLSNSILTDFDQICSTFLFFLRFFLRRLYLATPTFIIEPLFLPFTKNVGCSSASRLPYPNIYYRTVFILLYCSKAASKPWSFKIEAISSICFVSSSFEIVLS